MPGNLYLILAQGGLSGIVTNEIEMRKIVLGVVPMVLLFGGASVPAYSLTRNDTMMDWLHASDVDRSCLFDDLQANEKAEKTSRPELLACLNGAAKIAGHSELHIVDVAEVCSEQPSPANRQAPSSI